jgi:uncharacterized protein YeaO (DUF488 family)
MIQLKRVYADPSPDDGFRILVERLWPRGISKERAAIDLWFKEIAPSQELRKWFAHDPAKWSEFIRRYREELDQNSNSVGKLRQILESQTTVTFVYAASDPQQNSALLLKNYLEGSSD